MEQAKPAKPKQNIASLLGPYKGWVAILAAFTIIASGTTLVIPKLISRAIDAYGAGAFDARATVVWFLAVSVAIFAFTYLQSLMQGILAERAARDLRDRAAAKISSLSFSRLEEETPAKLLTNLTSDVDAVKRFVSFGVSTVISSVVTIIGAAILLLVTDWRLALAVLAVLPMIAVVFAVVFKGLGPLFVEAQQVVDRLNAVIGESVVGSALVRALDSGGQERVRFGFQNLAAKENSMKILKLFCIVVPSVGIIANLAQLVILALGGRFVIAGSLSLGEFMAFNSYVIILIFPIIMLGFISSVISQAQASYGRIASLLDQEEERAEGDIGELGRGEIEVRGVSLSYGEKQVLKGVSFTVPAGSKTAVIGPTAAGKTQLLHILIGLVQPQAGEVLYDGKPIGAYKREALHKKVAIVFQDSVMFNLTLRENIAFSASARDEDVRKAIETAELADFVASLPQGLDTVASERGTSLSGGQKQRIMLARALALDPQVLLLDDFTARVDAATEERIISNIEKNYPGITVVSVTQKVRSVERFDQAIVLMEGEVLAVGTHEELSATSTEYAQIAESQKSTHEYEA